MNTKEALNLKKGDKVLVKIGSYNNAEKFINEFKTGIVLGDWHKARRTQFISKIYCYIIIGFQIRTVYKIWPEDIIILVDDNIQVDIYNIGDIVELAWPTTSSCLIKVLFVKETVPRLKSRCNGTRQSLLKRRFLVRFNHEKICFHDGFVDLDEILRKIGHCDFDFDLGY